MNPSLPLEVKWRPVSMGSMLLKSAVFQLKFGWKYDLLWHLFWTTLYWSDGWNAVLRSNLVLLVFDAVVLALGVALDLWKERKAREFSIRIDEEGVEVCTCEGLRSLRWEQIHRLLEEKSAAPWAHSSWESLLGENGELLARWDSRWAHLVYRPEEFKQLLVAKEAIRQKLREMGRIVVPQHRFRGRRGPQIPRQVRNHLAIVGSIGLFVVALVTVAAGFPWGVSDTPFAPVWLVMAMVAGLGCLALIARNQGLSVSPAGIESYTIWRRRTLPWGQVQCVTLDEKEQTLSFETPGQPLRFQFNGLAAFSALGKADVLRFVKFHCETDGIPLSSNLQ